MSLTRYEIQDFQKHALALKDHSKYYETLSPHILAVATIINAKVHNHHSLKIVCNALINKFALDQEKPFFYLKKACDYIKSLKMSKFPHDVFVQHIVDAFDIKPTATNRIVVIDNNDWEPLDFNEALQFVFPQVVAMQAQLFLKALALSLSQAKQLTSTSMIKTSLANDFAVYSIDIKETLAKIEIDFPFAFINSIKEYQLPVLRKQVCNDVVKELWDAGKFSSLGSEELLKAITELFEEKGKLFEKYTNPLAKLYWKFNLKDFSTQFFPGLTVLSARTNFAPTPPTSPVKKPNDAKSPPASPSLLTSIKEDYCDRNPSPLSLG